MLELMQRYEESIERLYKANEWLESQSINSWEDIRGSKAYIKREKIIKEVEKMQEDIHSHMATS